MTSEQDPLKKLSSIFNDHALKSSSRLLILISLSLNKNLGFTELSRLTGLAKGSLGNHLAKLNSAGYVTIVEHSFFSSKRITIKITEKGLETVRKYLSAINELELGEKEGKNSTFSTDIIPQK